VLACISNVAFAKEYRLDCGVNVNCNKHADVINKMRTAFSTLYNSNNRVAKAYADACFGSVQRMEKLPVQLQGEPDIYQNQLDACNAGLYYLDK
jgi:hypothetical protein